VEGGDERMMKAASISSESIETKAKS
jgi:hypothetical protein